jgi:hypothetical protein
MKGLQIVAGGVLILSLQAADSPPRSLHAEVSEWFTSGKASWQKSFPSGATQVESELTFKDMDAPITLLQIDYPITPRVHLEGSYGFGRIRSGTGTDTDRQAGGAFLQSVTALEGDVELYSLLLSASFWERRGLRTFLDRDQQQRERLTGYIGHLHYEDRLTMTDGIQTVPASGSYGGLASRYDFAWDALLLGLRWDTTGGWIAEDSPLRYRLDAGFIPWLYYYGEGRWNLRSDLAQSPSFVHESRSGHGFLGKGSVSYAWRSWRGELGWSWLALRADPGEDRIEFSNGSSTKDRLDEVKATRHGPFLALRMSF